MQLGRACQGLPAGQAGIAGGSIHPGQGRAQEMVSPAGTPIEITLPASIPLCLVVKHI